MDASVRAQLKQAREALGRKEHQNALACCKAVLRDHPNSYEALVFVGKAAFGLHEYKQAEAAYQRATGQDPNNPLAWQGLAELYAETGQWSQAMQAFSSLAALANSSPEPGLQARAPVFLWRCGEAAMKAGLPAEAEPCWRRLLEETPEDCPEHLKLLCNLADAQLELEASELQDRIRERLLLHSQGLLEGTSEAAVCDAVEAEWARETLESNSSAATLRQIITAAPPSPLYAHYYSSYLRRLRTAVYAAPPQSMERHSRRAEVLHFALATMRGTSASGVPGGCCSMAPFEAALAMLEVEGNVAGAAAAATALDAGPHHAVSAAQHAGARAVAEAVAGGHAAPDMGIRGAGAELQLSGVEQVAKRLAHSFPWSPSASVHIALCLRRRSGSAARTTALVRPSDQKPGPRARAVTAPCTTNLNVLETRQMSMIQHLPAGARRRRLIKCLHNGLYQGGAAGSSAAGWLAIAELLLKERAAEAALDAAKRGLSYLAARDLLGHEALNQADLLLKLAAGRALAAMGGVPAPGSAGYTDVYVYRALMEGAEARAARGQAPSSQPSPADSKDRSSAAPQQPPDVQALHIGSMQGRLGSIQEGVQEGSFTSGGRDTSSAGGDSSSITPEGVPMEAKDTAREGRSRAQLAAAAEAEAWLGSLLLSGRVSAGLAPFARLAGSPAAADVTHQAKRCVAQLAIARGDLKHARQLYESLVGAAAAGRSGPQMPEPWAAAEYGTLLLVEGEHSAAYQQLRMSIEALGPSPRSIAAAAATPTYSVAQEAQHQCQAARFNLLAAQAAWVLGGECRTAHGHHAHYHLLASAAAAERACNAAAIVDDMLTLNCAKADCVAAFAMLGAWYLECAEDRGRALKCYERAVAIDPTSESAGEALMSLLRTLGLMERAHSLCEELVEASGVQWALRHLASLKLALGDHEGAVVVHQRAMRTERENPHLWEGLGASYHNLGRTSAALKSYTRALQLDPDRLYSLVQSGVLHYQMSSYAESEAAFARALKLAPRYPPALLGAAETALASAHRHASMGATGLASLQLQQAVHHAMRCTSVHGTLQAGWKLLGDAQLQHSTVTPHNHPLRTVLPSTTAAAAAAKGSVDGPAGGAAGGAAAGAAAKAAEGVVGALHARLERVRAASQAYARALRLDPTQGLVWGDMAMSLHQQALLHHMLALHTAPPTPTAPPSNSSDSSSSQQQHHHRQQQLLHRHAFRVIQGGLKLHPSSDWLWSVAGLLAAASTAGQQRQEPACQHTLGQAELCMSRALQLNPKRASTWAALGRLYATQEEGQLAQWCFDQCRSLEPTLVPVWEGMAYLAGRKSQAPGDAAYLDMMDAYEHAVGLGGSTESRLAFSTAAVLAGRGHEGDVLSACTKALAHQPCLPSAYNTLGLAEEARGHYAEAADAYAMAHALLQQQQRACQQQQQQQSGLVQLWETGCAAGGGAHSSNSSSMGGGTQWAAVGRALQLNRARALACAGKAAEAVNVFESLQAVEGAADADISPTSLLAHAHALHGVGRSQEAISVLESGLSASVAAEFAAAEAPGNISPQVVRTQRVGAALALCRAYCASGRVADAFALVQDQAGSPSGSIPCSGVTPRGPQPQEQTTHSLQLQMWLAVLVAAAASARGKAPVQGQQRVEEGVVRSALLSQLAAHPDVDQAQVHAAVHMVYADLAAADGHRTKSLRFAAAAVHACPRNASARARLSSAALAASPAYGAAAVRASAAPPTTPPTCHSAPVAAVSVPGVVQHHQQHLMPTRKGAGGGLLSRPPASAAVQNPTEQAPRPPQLPKDNVSPCLPLPEAGHHPSVQRASALLIQVSEDSSMLGLCHALEREVLHLSKLVHAHPSSAGYWYLLAVVSLHLAASSGGQCRLYRKALERSKVALGPAQLEYQQAAQAAAAEEASAAPAKPSMVLPPALQMLAPSLQQRATGPSVPGPAAAARDRMAYIILRLLTIVSECQLHARLPGGRAGAKEAATDALRFSLQHCPAHVALPHQQLGRCHIADGATATPNAEVSLSQAARGGDLPSTVEYARLLGLSACTAADLHHHRHLLQQQQQQQEGAPAVASVEGSAGSAAEWLAGALQAKSFSAQPWEQALLAAAHGAQVPLLWGHNDGGGLEAAQHVAKSLVEAQNLPLRARPAAHVLLAYACLALVAHHREAVSTGQQRPEAAEQPAETPEHRMKKLGLEARWAASTALKLLDTLESTSTKRILLLPANPQAVAPKKGGSRMPAVIVANGAAAGADAAGKRHGASTLGEGQARAATRALAAAALAAAEAGAGKHERALEAANQASQLGADTVPLLLASVAGLAQAKGSMQFLTAKAVHAQPWYREGWELLRNGRGQ